MIAFGRYQLLRKFATGGMAEVWLARDPERFVALKRLLPHLSGEAELMRMFVAELRFFTRLVHPNIAQLYEVGEQHLAMELVHGEDLGRIQRKAWKENTRVGPAIALRVAAEVCRALAYAQSLTDDRGQPLGVVHRSVDPQNIRVAFDGSVKLLDFGLARVLDQLPSFGIAMLRGKFVYLAPEQVAGKPLDGRTDLFTLGLVLYELLTGVRPLRGDSELSTLKAAMECRFEPPSHVAELPPGLDELVMRALAREPADRYPDAAAFLAELERHPLATREQLAALMGDLFPEQDLVIERLPDGDEPLRVAYRGGDTVTLENEKTGACWFLTRDDVLGVRADGVVELEGREMGKQEVGRVAPGAAVTAFLETVAASSRCGLRR